VGRSGRTLRGAATGIRDREGVRCWDREKQKEGDGDWREKVGRNLGLVGIYTRTGNRYRADYRAGKNRAVLRAGSTCRGGGPSTKSSSGRAGTKHY
jgi:hypothetical protein